MLQLHNQLEILAGNGDCYQRTLIDDQNQSGRNTKDRKKE